MAKRRKARTRTIKTRTRTVFKRAKRRQSSSNNTKLFPVILGGMGYGAGREYVSQLIEPITSKIPILGNLADELGMGVLSYYMAKGKIPIIGKNKIVKEIGRAGLYIESARTGDYLLNSFMPKQTNNQTKGTMNSFR